MGLFGSLFGSRLDDSAERHFQDFIREANAGNNQRALSSLIAAADRNHVEAMALLGNVYYNGDLVPKNYDKAFYYSQKAALAGSVDGQYQLGHLYNRGYGTEKNEDKALFYLKQAADAGHENALFMYEYTYYIERERYKLGMDLFEGRNGHEKNVPEAIRIWEKCVNTFNDCTAMYFLAHADIVGAPPYVPQNIPSGVAKMVKAAKMGEAEAFFWLMQMFREGKAYHGVPFEVNEDLAGAYAVEIAEAIDESSEEYTIESYYGNAAWACLYGHGVPVNYAKSRKFMNKVSPSLKKDFSDIDSELTKLGY